MKIENPVIYNLRITTVEIIEKLYCSGRYGSYKIACQEIFNVSRQKNQLTGFAQNDFEKFYQSYRKFKSENSKLHKTSQTQ